MHHTMLPSPLDAFVNSVNGGDTLAFLQFFPLDGVVNDWGREFVGHAAIRGWSDKEFIGAKGHLAVTRVSRAGDEVTVDAGWRSNYYSGESRFVFVLEGQKIRQMHIVEA